MEKRIDRLIQQLQDNQLRTDLRWVEIMGRWNKNIALDAEALEDCIGLAIHISDHAEQIYARTGDVIALRDHEMAKRIVEKLRDIRSRCYPQGRLFEEEDG